MDRRTFAGTISSSFLVGLAGGGVTGAGATAAICAPLQLPWGLLSHSQQGEDLVVSMLFHRLGVERPSYLDIGAARPVAQNNTYWFYERGSRGVLVEPNPALCKELRSVRPGDTVLQAGIRFGEGPAEADYYVIGGSPASQDLNTFSKDWAEGISRRRDGRFFVEKVLKMPLIPVNEVMAKYFVSGGPRFVSLDAEGVDLEILKTFDFDRFRPALLCVESPSLGDTTIPDLLRSRGYKVCASTFVNNIFVDEALFAKLG